MSNRWKQIVAVLGAALMLDATAVGNYSRVINYNNLGRYVKNRWHIN